LLPTQSPADGAKLDGMLLLQPRKPKPAIMKKLLLTILLSLSILCGFSQAKFGITIYQNTDLFELIRFDRNNNRETDQKLNFHRFSVALSYNLRGKYAHELEIFIPEFKKSPEQMMFPYNLLYRKYDDGQVAEVSSYSFRYELYRRITKQKPLTFALGAALHPYYVTLNRPAYQSYVRTMEKYSEHHSMLFHEFSGR
jgi:hypothetical protein